MLETSMQAQFLIPMAATIAYGLAVATVVILLILPVFISLFNDFSRFKIWFWTDAKPSPEEVEPAFQEQKFEKETEDIS